MFGNRICWRYHCPSIHYYQTINYYLYWIKTHKFDRKQLNHIFCKYAIWCCIIIWSNEIFQWVFGTNKGRHTYFYQIIWRKIYTILEMDPNIMKIISSEKIAYKKVILIPSWHEYLIHMKNGRSHISVQITRPYVIVPNKNLSCVQFYVSYQIKV